MNINNVELICVAAKKEQYPETELYEVAFVGKSNVGKSSLINSMVNRKSLARTSSSPGKTRTINFYCVENFVNFVDLPGYGYARASKTEVAKWGKMIEEYLLKRAQLKAIIMLVDIRHAPNDNDKTMYEWLRHYGYQIIIVATKSDKLKRSQINKSLSIISKGLSLREQDILIPFSSQTKDGRDKLWEIIKGLTLR